jgi:hypothetical protein
LQTVRCGGGEWCVRPAAAFSGVVGDLERGKAIQGVTTRGNSCDAAQTQRA